MRFLDFVHSAARQTGRGRVVLLALGTALLVWTPLRAEAQLPSLVDLSVPLGQEVTPVYRVFGDILNSVNTGDIEQAGALAMGDFNGDGLGDLLMGTPTAKVAGGPTVVGGAYILYGALDLPGTYANLFTDGIVSEGETRIVGGGADYVAGHAVAVGDVDGDGYDDAIIGEPGIGGTDPGRVRVVYGSATLPNRIVDLTAPVSAAEVATTEVIGVLDTADPEKPSAQLGRAVTSGDINGDGFDDIVIGAYRSDTPGGTDAGAVYVVFGSAALRGTSLTTASSGVTGILGDDADDGFGWAVATGDVNGNGFDDVVVGAPKADPSGGADAGEVHVLYGAPTWPATIDLNTNNGAVSAAGETRIVGDDASDTLGCAVATGDVNSDGFDEVLIGAFRAVPASRGNAGEAYVIYGRATLPNSIVNMNTSIGSSGESRLFGVTFGDQTGFSVAAGDVDGDGRADVLAGARQAVSIGGTEPGLLYFIPGATIPAANGIDITSVTGSVLVKGTKAYDFFGSSSVGAADMNRDGYGEFAGLAAQGDNPFITADPSNNVSYAVAVFGDGSSATASATTSFAAGATPLKGLGGRLSPGLRTWLSFADGTASRASALLTRGAAAVSNIPEADPVDVAQVLWQLSTTRTGWTSAHVTLRYTDSEVAGLDEVKLVLYQAASPTGVWTPLAAASQPESGFDIARNEISVDVSSLGYFAIAADSVAPGLAIGPPSIDLTRDTPVTYTVTYTRASAITLTAEDVDLITTGSASATVAVTGSGIETRVITLSNLAGDGTIGIALPEGTAHDENNNLAPSAGPSVTFRVDHTAPAVVIGAPSLEQTASGPVAYVVTYTGASAVTLGAGNIQLIRTGTANGEVSVTGAAGFGERTVTLSNITGNGTLNISIDAATAVDELGNPAPAVGPAAAFTVDNAPPTVAIGSPSTDNTQGGPVTFTITYENASDISLTSGQVTLNRTGSADASVAVTGSGATTRTVTLSGITGDGTLGISLQAGTATDALGNAALAAGPSATFTADNTAPTISIGAPSPTQTQTGPVSFLVTYSGATGITLAPGDVSLVATGDADGTIAIQTTSASARTVVIENITGNGTLGISLAPGTATDDVGNPAPAAGPSANVAVGNVTLAVSMGEPSTTLTSGGPVVFTITYTGAQEVTLDDTKVVFDTTGTVTGVVAVQGAGTSERSVVVSNLTGNGTFTISIAAGTATNTQGNTALEVGPSTAVTVDNTAPTIVIGAPSVTQTQSGPVTFSIEYQGATSVTLASGDVSLVATGTATANLAVSGSGIGPRTVTLSNVAGNGTLAISVAPGTALDAAGNAAPAAGPSATVTVRNTVFLPADVNRDTRINATDVQLVINAALGRTVIGFPDVNGDGRVNATDVQRVINAVLGRG